MRPAKNLCIVHCNLGVIQPLTLFLYLIVFYPAGEGAEVLETIRVQPQSTQELTCQSNSISFTHSTANESPSATAMSASPSASATHPSWWIQDFLHTTLGIARRKKGSPDSPDINKDGGKSVQDPDPASTSGQIQLWQVDLLFFFKLK